MFALTILTVSQPSGARFLAAHVGKRVARAWDILSRFESGRPEMAKFLKLIKNEEGATAIEYGLIAALIAVAAIGAMQGIGNKLNTTFNNVSNNLPSS
jgi:pilus assembly protein Flp/PilA